MTGFNTTNAQYWLKRNTVKLAWALAILCLLITVANIIWHVRSTYISKKANYAPQEQFKLTVSKGPNYQINQVVRANLFGDPTPAPVAKKVKKTTLDLTLKGVLWATDDGIARAIIQAGKKDSKLYSIGDDIDGANASVREIRDNEIILNRNGASESLPLAKIKGSDGIISFTSAGQGGITNASYTAPTLPAVNTTNFRPSSSNDTSTEKRRIRKPNFSGLDRALRKAGEI